MYNGQTIWVYVTSTWPLEQFDILAGISSIIIYKSYQNCKKKKKNTADQETNVLRVLKSLIKKKIIFHLLGA